MLVALLMGTPRVDELATWKLLKVSFLDHYREQILEWYGYETGNTSSDKRIYVEDPHLVVRVFAALKQEGMFGKTSHTELSHALVQVFCIPYSQVTLLNELKKYKNEELEEVFELISILKNL